MAGKYVLIVFIAKLLQDFKRDLHGQKKDKNYSPSLNIEKINQHLAYNAGLLNKLAVLHQQCCFAIIFCLELQYMYIMLIYLLL